MKQVLKGAVRVMRHVPDRALHSFRRRSAARDAATRSPASILFVCHGNICRSPFAAALFEQLARERLLTNIRVESAGFIGPGRPSPQEALDAAARRGIDMSAHRSQLLRERLVRDSDLVVVMSSDQARGIRRFRQPNILVLGDLDPQEISERTIKDPWGGTDADFDESYERIDRCIRRLVAAIADEDT